VGVIRITSAIGQNAGSRFQTADRAWSAINVSIPVATCTNTGKFAWTRTDQLRLREFANSFYISDPTLRSSPFNDTLAISNVTISDNLWIGLFDDTLYKTAFHFVTPLIYFIITILAVRFANERFAKVYRSRKVKSFGQALQLCLTTPPFMALVIEACSTATLGIFYAVDGMWSNANSAMTSLRALFFGQLFLVSLATSVLVGLNFADFRKAQKNKEMMSGKSFSDRHRSVLWFTAAVFAAVEILGQYLRPIANLYVFVNLVAILFGFVVSGWFLLEARWFSAAINKMAATTQGQQGGGAPSTNTLFKNMVRRIVVWTHVANVGLLGTMALGLWGTFKINWLLNVANWPYFWFAAQITRGLCSLGKVMLCRLPNNERGASKSTASVRASSTLQAHGHESPKAKEVIPKS
jgi:hypothetical protein